MPPKTLRYRIPEGREPYFDNGGRGLIPASGPNGESFVDIAEDELPSWQWEGTDEKSNAAVAVARQVHEHKQRRARKFEEIARGFAVRDPNDPELRPVVIPPPFDGPVKRREAAQYAPRPVVTTPVQPLPSTSSELQKSHRGKVRASDQEVA